MAKISWISGWLLLMAMMLCDDVMTTRTSWTTGGRPGSPGSPGSVPISNVLHHLASILKQLKSLGLSNDVIKNAVDLNLQKQDKELLLSFPEVRRQRMAKAHRKYPRYSLNPESFVADSSGDTPSYSAMDPDTAASRRMTSYYQVLPQIQAQIRPGGRSRSVRNRYTGTLKWQRADAEENAFAPDLAKTRKPGWKTDRNRNRNRQMLKTWSRQGKIQSADGHDNFLTNGSRLADARQTLSALVSTLKQVADDEEERESSSKSVERFIQRPLSPIRGVSVEVTLPDDVTHRQTVALSPSLSVYNAIYQAALAYDYDSNQSNPFEISIEPDLKRKCYVISRISEYDDNNWLIIVLDSFGEPKYEGVCLPSNSKQPLRSGYTIHIEPQTVDRQPATSA